MKIKKFGPVENLGFQTSSYKGAGPPGLGGGSCGPHSRSILRSHFGSKNGTTFGARKWSHFWRQKWIFCVHFRGPHVTPESGPEMVPHPGPQMAPPFGAKNGIFSALPDKNCSKNGTTKKQWPQNEGQISAQRKSHYK
jgi:hypothetical protein